MYFIYKISIIFNKIIEILYIKYIFLNFLLIKIHKVLGKGSYGKVMLVEYIGNGNIFHKNINFTRKIICNENNFEKKYKK